MRWNGVLQYVQYDKEYPRGCLISMVEKSALLMDIVPHTETSQQRRAYCDFTVCMYRDLITVQLLFKI
jgi:hypothetical protein